MPGGGCVVTHEDITELRAARAAANERLSLQALIDRLPDNLWVKDINSRFVIANQATADRIGVAEPAELIGKTDFELLPAGDRAKILRRRTGDRSQRQPDGRPGGNRLGLEARDLDDEGAAAQRAQRNFRRGRGLARHHRAQAGGSPARRAGANPRNDRDERSAGRRARATRSSDRIAIQGDRRLRPAARRSRRADCGTAPRRACRTPTPRRSTARASVPRRARAARPPIGGKSSSSPTS